MTPVEALREQGQSLWYDYIHREMLQSGELDRLIQQGLRGMTSNPTIFAVAFRDAASYRTGIDRALRSGAGGPETVYERVVLEEIAAAAHALRPVYDQSGGQDGYVSLEVSPYLADDVEATVAEAARLAASLGRANVMIKVPATASGMEAIRALIGVGISVNVTLIFGLSAYGQVIGAYLDGIEDRIAKGLPVDPVRSVASFFVSRIDSRIDGAIAARGLDPTWAGRAAIAQARRAYAFFREAFTGPRFARLRSQGATEQRLLWASTGVKNPRYPDLRYVESLVGPGTISTVTPATWGAIWDHARIARTVDQGLDEASAFLKTLDGAGLSFEEAAHTLLAEGLEGFRRSYDQALATMSGYLMPTRGNA